jgi:hypothetical protein
MTPYIKELASVRANFCSPSGSALAAMTTRQYAWLVADSFAGIGLDPHMFGTHSPRRTKATLIYPPP